MPFFSRVFKAKEDGRQKSAVPAVSSTSPAKVQWSDAWLRTRVDPEEVVELLHECTAEVKSRGLDLPLLLLPFRPSSDPSAARTFVRNFFFPRNERERLTGSTLRSELRMTEVMVIVSVMKWCWARLPGGIVTWETYEGFKVGEKGSRYSRDAFKTFIPICVDTKPRAPIIFDFFDLLAAVAAHGKSNGLGGLKLSRYAGWWAFGHIDTGNGFDAGYKSWDSAAEASSHLFFAYLRSLSPDTGMTNGILSLPRSLQQLLDSVQYPPPRSLILNETTRVVMIVDGVSPTPYALLRRAKNFEYRHSDRALQEFASFDDPVEALTDECRRVLKSISSTNASAGSNTKTFTSLAEPSWSRFEDIGFGSTLDESAEGDDWFSSRPRSLLDAQAKGGVDDLGRPTTPSWADFLSSGFAEENGAGKSLRPVLRPLDKTLPPLNGAPRGQSSQSHRRDVGGNQQDLDPGELAGISSTHLDDAFWWVWISSLASEEPVSRKAVFGRCAVVETRLPDGHWMVIEEQVKGAAAEPAVGTYIAEKKKSFFSFSSKRGRLSRRRSALKKEAAVQQPNGFDAQRTAALGPDQHARIQQVAEELSKKKAAEVEAVRRQEEANKENIDHSERNSVYTLGAISAEDLSPAMQWARQYDKDEIRAKYLGDVLAGKRSTLDLLATPSQAGSTNASKTTLSSVSKEIKDLPAAPLPANDKSRTQLPAESRIEPGSPSPGPVARAPAVDSGRASPALSQGPGPRVPGPSVRAQAARLLAQEAPSVSSPSPPPAKAAAARQAYPLSQSSSSSSSPSPRNLASVKPDAGSKHFSVHEDAPAAVSTTGQDSATREAAAAAAAAATATASSTNGVRTASIDGSSSTMSSEERAQQGSAPIAPRNGGIRRLFGSKRPTRDVDEAGDGQRPLRPESPQQPNSAVAAARRALEGKAALANSTPSLRVKANHFERNKVAKNPIFAAAAAATSSSSSSPPAQPPSQKPAPARALSPLSNHVVPDKVEAPTAEVEEGRAKAAEEKSPKAAAPTEVVLPVPSPEANGISAHARADAEDDQLSRVPTSEHEHANRAFSTFDQGPLVEQPAFVPEDTPDDVPDKGAAAAAAAAAVVNRDEGDAAPKHYSVYSSVSVPVDETDSEDEEATTPVSPMDRWAQIRKNAAERAARQSAEDKTRRGLAAETAKTDDEGETSGEETIESRVARIKARVAELTGNIDATRR